MGTPEVPKPRKSFLELTSRMKRKRTDNLQGKELEELQHAVKWFASNPSFAPRSNIWSKFIIAYFLQFENNRQNMG